MFLSALRTFACGLTLAAVVFFSNTAAEARTGFRHHHARFVGGYHHRVAYHTFYRWHRPTFRLTRRFRYVPVRHTSRFGFGRALGAAMQAPISAGAYAADSIRISMRYLGWGNPTGTRGPWCGDFQNLVERQAGRPGIASRMARDWRNYGRASGPVTGAIAVFPGHVGRVIDRVGDKVRVISGNYAHHRVGIGFYSIGRAIAFRMP